MKYLAIDYGDKRTGLAVCDDSETIVSPLTVVEGRKDLLGKITNLVKSQNVKAIVLGLPLNMDDSQGPQAKLVLQFAQQLKKHIDIPIHFQDERLSSFAAERNLAAAELTRGKKKKRLDAVAAAEILKTFLENKPA
jgi:putative Holliday junction resolvase